MPVKFWAATASLFALLPVYILLPFSSAIAMELRLAQEDMDMETQNPIETLEPLPGLGEIEPADPPIETPGSELILFEQGDLQDGDPMLPTDGSLYHQHTFFGEVGQTVRITVKSSDFDTYLALFNPEDDLLEENDDIDETNTNSEIIITLPVTGTYRVIVNAYDADGRGNYELQVIQFEGAVE